MPRLYKISFATVLAIYFLIAVGGIVRSTGAGMGCPDWPKCFGSWVPPTSEAQLPLQYKEHYASLRVEKNERLAGTLASLGFVSKAEEILNDPTISEEQEFNALKTWIEYVNRLIGALIGLFILATLFTSLKYIKSHPILPIASFAAVILVLFQAWLGSLVVSTNLLEWMITAHMLIALVIVMLLIWIFFKAEQADVRYIKDGNRMKYNALLPVFLVLLIVQVVLGTQVRESIDQVSAALGPALRMEWIDALGISFIIHRSYSILLLLTFAAMWKTYSKEVRLDQRLGLLFKVLGIGILLSVLTGVIMAYFGVPAFAQPLHLLFGSLIVGVQFYLIMYVKAGGRARFHEIEGQPFNVAVKV